VTVALSGDGGDELFAGYRRYLWAGSLIRTLDPIPSAVRRRLGLAPRSLYRAWSKITGASHAAATEAAIRQMRPLAEALRKSSEILPLENAHAMYRRTLSLWQDPHEVLQGTSVAEDPVLQAAAEVAGSPVEWMTYADLVSYLPDDILVKVDRASMAVALEVRVPFLDHTLVEFAQSLPLAFKIQGDDTKVLLKRLLARYVPQSLFDRPKQGFGAPVPMWLRGPLRTWAQDLLAESALREHGVFRTDIVQKALREHLTDRRDRSAELWPVLMFQAWYADTFAKSGGGVEARRPSRAVAS
jgi:asparagine synthase (glutamine-hydrolysing)